MSLLLPAGYPAVVLQGFEPTPALAPADRHPLDRGFEPARFPVAGNTPDPMHRPAGFVLPPDRCI